MTVLTLKFIHISISVLRLVSFIIHHFNVKKEIENVVMICDSATKYYLLTLTLNRFSN